MSFATNKGCPPALALERFMEGQITHSSSAAWNKHIKHCLDCKNKLHEMKQHGEDYALSPEREKLIQILEEKEKHRSRFQKWPVLRILRYATVPTVLAAACITIMVYMGPLENEFQAERGQTETFQTKGIGAISVTLVRDGAFLPWEEKTLLMEGDVVQLSWTADQSGYLAVLVRDANGQVSVIFPENGRQGAKVKAGSDVPVGQGLGVDSTTSDSRLWVFYADNTFPLDPLLNELASAEFPSFDSFSGKVSALLLKIRDQEEK